MRQVIKGHERIPADVSSLKERIQPTVAFGLRLISFESLQLISQLACNTVDEFDVVFR